MLWIGFWGGGLARLNPLINKIDFWRHEPDNSESLSFNDVWAITQDRKGRIWIGTNGRGLNLFNPEKQNSFSHWRANNDEANSLSNDNIFTLSEATAGNIGDDLTILWIGTANGLNKFIIKNDPDSLHDTKPEVKISSYTVEDGLPDNSIESVLEDENGNLWIGTSSGISFFNMKSETFTNFGPDDGLKVGSNNSTAGLKTKDGLMIFGSTSGVNFFNPKRISQSRFSPPVLITEFQLFNHQDEDGDSLIKKSIVFTKGIDLSFRQNDFSLQFTSLDYNAPEAIQYAYRLEGFEDDWTYCGNRRFVTYTNLDPGNYVFHVKATNSDGVWNEAETKLTLVIKPPFWETWWAYSIYIILFFSSLGLIRAAEIKRREKKEEERLRREREAALLREAKLKAITIEQEKELEKQKIRNRIAQDLHDEVGSNLSSISLMSELIQRDGKINKDDFEKIQRIRKVAKGSSQAMRDIVWLTNPSSDNIKDLASKMNEVANNMLGGLDWQFDFPRNLSEINLIPEVKRNLFFIYKESLNNILKHSGAKNVKIKLGFDDQHISLTIKDDGKGFNATQGFPGNGLKNLQNRANEINGLLTLNSSPGKGTALSLEVNITHVRD
jgi:signal transduction histidine kinase